MLPNWSRTVTTGAGENQPPGATLEGGWIVKLSCGTPAVSVNVPKLVLSLVIPGTVAVPGLAEVRRMFPEISGVPVVLVAR